MQAGLWHSSRYKKSERAEENHLKVYHLFMNWYRECSREQSSISLCIQMLSKGNHFGYLMPSFPSLLCFFFFLQRKKSFSVWARERVFVGGDEQPQGRDSSDDNVQRMMCNLNSRIYDVNDDVVDRVWVSMSEVATNKSLFHFSCRPTRLSYWPQIDNNFIFISRARPKSRYNFIIPSLRVLAVKKRDSKKIDQKMKWNWNFDDKCRWVPANWQSNFRTFPSISSNIASTL